MINITIRECKEDKTPIIFFYEGSDLACYQKTGQHSAASVEYMHTCTTPLKTMTKEAEALIKEWAKGEYVRIMQRLTKPRM